MLSEPIAVAMLVIEALEALEAPYLIGGSLASAVHGVARATMDADLLAELRPLHADPLAKALSGEFYADPAAILDAIQRCSSFNVIHLATAFKVDVFVSRMRPFDRSQMERRTAQVLAREPERTAYVATAEDTVLSKLEWYRMGGEISERQWRDVLGVLRVQRVQGDRLDRAYLTRWADALGVSDLLEQVLAEVAQRERSE
jgi:hypothetical protein